MTENASSTSPSAQAPVNRPALSGVLITGASSGIGGARQALLSGIRQANAAERYRPQA